jgi:uncharacterized membrane protein
MIWIFMLIFLVIGAALGHEWGAVAGALIGLAIGGVVQALTLGIGRTRLTARVEKLELELTQLRRLLAEQRGAAPAAEAAAPAIPPPVLAETVAPSAIPQPPSIAAAPPPPPAPPPPAPPPPPDALERAFAAARAWALGGNLVARLGLLTLFVGVGFLLKYSIDHAMLPVEFRLAGVAIGAIGLLGAGWHTRRQHDLYGLLLQGGGVGLLYLDIFGASRLYGMLPPAAAFPLLVVVCALAALLAVRQDAPSLAVMGSAGGFLAPILVSTGGGSHVALFSYYAILDLGIFGIAWFKAWRALNVLGFAFTYTIAAAWGVLSYQPEQLASTEPFVILFFAIFFGVALLYALRRSLSMRHYLDGTLLFGTPLATIGLQVGLLRDVPFGLAWSAVALAFVYLGAAFGVRRARLLREAILAIGIGFATLAIPLAVEGRITAAIWAVEGVGLLWLARRQTHLLGAIAALGLQIFAALAFLSQFASFSPAGWRTATPFANPAYAGALVIAIAGLACGWLLSRPPARREPEAALAGWGLLWWLGATIAELLRTPLENGGGLLWTQNGLILLAVATGVIAYLLYRLPGWRLPRLAIPALPPALLAAVVLFHGLALTHGATPPLSQFGLLLAAILVSFALLWLTEAELPAPAVGPCHAALFWTVVLLLGWQAYARVSLYVPQGAWSWSAWGFGVGLGLAALAMAGPRLRWPIGRHARAYLIIGAAPVVVLLGGWAFLSALSDGDAAPLPYLPLLNPLDVSVLVAALALVAWWRAARGMGFLPGPPDRAPGPLAVGFGFVFANAVLLRTLHYWQGIPYRPETLFASTLAQAAISVFWTCLALAGMLLATRRRERLPWLIGAGLLGITLVKMFLFDLSHLAGAPRFIAFISVGVLLLAIGYLSPLPPRHAAPPAVAPAP